LQESVWKVDIMVPRKVIEYHMARLKDKRPDVRLSAIKELELIAAPETLDALRAVYENDEDGSVRKAAQEAGRKIFLKRNNSEEMS
jgi:HEAT repeat protein